MPVLRAAQRRQLRQLYGFRCGYCGISEKEVGSELTEDHFQPTAHGGTNDFINMVYACHQCNEFKKDYWNPHSPERILHPLNADTTPHLQLSDDGTITGSTDTGRFHIARLRLNRPGLVALRQEKAEIRRNNERIAALEEGIAEIRTVLQEIVKRLPASTQE